MKKISLLILTIGLCVLGITYNIEQLTNRPHHFKVTFLNIGQGDSALIQFTNGQKMLVDCGPNKIVLSRLGEALPFYDRTIDYVLATHPDLDHYGGCVDVLKQYKVKEVIVNGREKITDPYWQEWNKTMHASGAAIKVINGEATWMIASSTLHFMSPDPLLHLVAKEDDSNNFSIIFKLTSDTGKTFLFTGDMEVPLEQAVMKKYCRTPSPSSSPSPPFASASAGKRAEGDTISPSSPRGGEGELPKSCPALQSDILKVGHHGSKSSSGQDFLSTVRPQVAIVSVGKDNHYGHPSLRVLKKLERAGATIRRTDQEGDIVVE